jgi:hypothetical protein
MAAKKGKSKSAKVPGLKSKKLTTEQAGQVRGGVGIELGHKDLVAQRPGGIKLPGDQMSGDFHIKFVNRG